MKVAATVTSELGADPEHRYAIPYEKLSSGSKTTKFTVQFNPDRTIKSINAQAKDHTAEIIAGVLDFAGTVGTAVATGGLAPGLSETDKNQEYETKLEDPVKICKDEVVDLFKEKEDLEDLIDTDEKLLAKKSAKIDLWKSVLSGQGTDAAKAINEIETLQKEQDKIFDDGLRENKKKLNEAIEILQHTQHYTFTPTLESENLKIKDDLKMGDEAKKKWFTKDALAHERAKEDIVNATNAQVVLYFAQLDKGGELNKLPVPPKFDFSQYDDKDIPGILLRDPVEADLFVCAQKCEVSRIALAEAVMKAQRDLANVRAGAAAAADPAEAVSLALQDATNTLAYKGRFVVPQAGTVLLVTLENGPFEENSVEVVFSPDGKIEKFSYGENAALADAITALSGSAGTAATIASDILNADTAKQKVKNDDLEARKSYLELKKAIKELEDEGFD